MLLSSSSSMLNFYFCKVSLFFLVILPSFNCVPSLHHSSNLLSKNLPVLLLNNIKKYLDLAYIFFLPPNFSYKMYIQKSMYNLKNNKISDHVLINKIKNCFFFMLSTVNPHHLQIQPTMGHVLLLYLLLKKIHIYMDLCNSNPSCSRVNCVVFSMLILLFASSFN